MGNGASLPLIQNGAAASEPEWLKGEDELQAFLEANGVSTEALGKGSAKSLTNLLYELRGQASFLELQIPDDQEKAGSGRQQPRVLRIVEPVFIRLCWRSHVLVQEEQRLTDGRMRTRRMLLAEKKEPCDGGGLFATIVRALHEELGLDVEDLQKEGALVYRADAYHFELEQIDSPSYPGLASMYRTHHVMVDIPDDSLELFRRCGLPDCRDFVTLETTELGTTTHYWRWYDTTEALRQSVVKFPPQVLSSNTLLPDANAGAAAPGGGGAGAAPEAPAWRTLPKEELKGEEELAKLLEKAGIDPARYGTGKAKTIGALLKEVQKGESSLEWHEQQASVRRIAEPVFIQFRWRDRVLVEAEQRFDDGRTRKRNMLLAEKKSPEDTDVSETALRGLREELDLPEEFPPLEGMVHFMQEAYCCVAENLESSSYPGLPCVYVTHYCAVQILDAGVPHFEKLGMLGDEFETKEKDKVNAWRWTQLDEARKSKVKGFPELKEQKSSAEQAAFSYEPLADVPLDAASLRVLLEVGGVNVSAWGEYAPASLQSLARELETGAAHLERDASTGKIRRVLRSNLVQLMVEEGSGGMLSESLRNAGDASQGCNSAASGGGGAFGMEEARGLVHFRSDLACFEVVHADTASYPGLPCCHQTRLVQFDQRNAGVPTKAAPPPAATAASAAPYKSERSAASAAKSGLTLASSYTSTATSVSEVSAAARTVQEHGSYPRLLDDVFTGERRGSEGDAAKLSLPLGGQSTRRNSMSRLGRFRSVSILSRDDGFPLDQGRTSIVAASEGSPTSRLSQNSAANTDEPCSPKRRSLYRQLRSLNRHLRFRMVANEAQQEKPPPAEHAVACSCDIQLIRNINPLNATFHCRFAVYLEWVDSKAVGMPAGEVPPEKLKELSIPEIALQNTLATNLEIHSPPEVVNPETGHVACKVLFQALMQMELNMRLFPFDEQRLVLVLGLRARRDRNRAIFCQFCNVDRQIRLDEWRLTSSFLHADRPDGRARVQFGVVISRAYWYYLVNVLGTLVGIASMSLVGFLLHRNPPFDRLRFGVAVLFAQTTFRLSIENKLPKVSYSTAFDQYAIFCQLLVLTIMISNAVASLVQSEVGRVMDRILACALGGVWVLGNVSFVTCVRSARRSQHQALEQLSDQDTSAAGAASPDAAPQAQEELEKLKDSLHYRGTGRSSVIPGEFQCSVRAVSVATRIWLLHDIDPVSATFECKFTVYLEWLHEGAVGLQEGQPLSAEQLAQLDPPEVDVHNKVELTVEEGPCAYVMNATLGQIMLCYTYHARLQIHLNLRRFPFDCQRLPINLLMPNQKDQDRAFIYRSCHLAQTARSLDEWFVDGLKSSTDYTEGLAQAMLEVCIRRRSGYYVVSVLSVLLGISSLMFTVFVIDVGADGMGFADQGKILVPLLMTLLAFKLLIASGKIPKAAYATIFDRIMLACEALFFLTISLCSITLLLALSPRTAASATSFKTHAGVVLLTAWLLYGVLIAVEVRCGREGGSSSASLAGAGRITPTFEQQRRSLTSQPLLSALNNAPKPATSRAVVLRIQVKQVHSVNATTGAFTCDFVASLAWMTDGAKELMEGEPLGAEKLRELHLPALRVQNALSCKQTVLSGVVANPATGHVACQVHVRATVQMHFHLEDFPFDRQALAVVLSLPEPRDLHRHLVLESCENKDAVKISEWAVLGTFAGAGRHDGITQAVFGVTIQRYSRYYVTSLKSLCLWSIFVFTMYTIDFQEFRNRGKILVSVLLVSIVGKLAVSSKLPRIARLTSYDRVALNSLALLFGVGCSAAFWCLVGKLRLPFLSIPTIRRMDQACGIFIFLAWACANLRVVCRMRQALSGAKCQAPDEVPAEFWMAATEGEEAEPWELPSPDVAKELEVLHEPEQLFAGLGEQTETPRDVARKQHNNTLTHCQAEMGISVGMKLWMVCNVDASTATFECKFHVFLEWCSTAAVGLPESTRISSRANLGAGDAAARVERPRLVVKGAIAVLLEDYSDVEIRNPETGLVSCRVQYHVRVHHRFNLRCFPFDCQRLEVELELQNCRDRFLLSDFCDADDQTTHLDGWRLVALSMKQDDSIPRQVSALVLVERESGYYVTHVIAIFFFLTTLLFSFFLMRPHEFAKRLVDVLKIVLTQTTFRFSVEHRLPKVQHWTPFDAYVISCQALCCCIVVSFIYSALSVRDQSRACAVQESEHYVLAALVGVWLLWNAVCALQARRVKRRELQTWAPDSAIVAALRPRSSTSSLESLNEEEPIVTPKPSSRSSVSSSMSLGGGVRPWELDALSSANMGEQAPQVVSVAFRIWLVRNVDLVTATFECKFRVFLEWLDEDAIGLPKGKKAKLPVPEIAITNSVQSQVLDKSSAPEVVNSDTGHLAVQILYRATLRIDQEVHQFPFDCQWLAITLSLRDEGAERSRSFMFQYCEMDSQLQLDEWQVHPKPGFSTLTKHDAPSIQDTVMCGVLIRRCCRYYVVNIMGMLCLISSLVFAIYTIDMKDFWARAEVFLGVFPVTVVFKMSAQGKLPRVGYSTKFDQYASSCQILFLAIVLGCMIASMTINLPKWLATCNAPDYDLGVVEIVGRVESLFALGLLLLWLMWNAYFTFQAWRQTRLPPLVALKSSVPIKLQDDEQLLRCKSDREVNGLAPRLSVLAVKEKDLEDNIEKAEAQDQAENEKPVVVV